VVRHPTATLPALLLASAALHGQADEVDGLDVLALCLGDVDLVAGTVRVQNGRGRKPRVIPSLPRVCEALSDWLEFRPRRTARWLAW
jgi:integrase